MALHHSGSPSDDAPDVRSTTTAERPTTTHLSGHPEGHGARQHGEVKISPPIPITWPRSEVQVGLRTPEWLLP